MPSGEGSVDGAPTGGRHPVTELRVDVRSLNRIIAAGLTVVLAGAAVSIAVLRGGGYETLPAGRALVSWLHLDSEQALPAVFSALLILTAAALIVVLTAVAEPAHTARRYRFRWRALAVVLALLALDELMGVHESISAELRSAMSVDGLLHHAWIVPYLVLAAVVASAMFWPLLALPVRTRALVIAAGVCYVVGAAGAKVLDAALEGAGPVASELLVTGEELLEIAGMWLLVGAVLHELSGHAVRIEVTPPRQRGGRQGEGQQSKGRHRTGGHGPP